MTERPYALEDQEQEALFHWAAIEAKTYPELEFMFHVPNGGRRDKKTAIMLKKTGVKAGVPDIFLPAPRRGYHGLFIEMKVGKNRPTVFQERYMAFLNEQRYLAIVCYGWVNTVEAIMNYLKMEV